MSRSQRIGAKEKKSSPKSTSTLRRSTRNIHSNPVDTSMQNSAKTSMQNKKVNSALKPIKNNIVVKQNTKRLKETGNNKVKVASNATKSPLISRLRTRKTVKYAESSLEMSQTDKKPSGNKKVPIYNQAVGEKPTKRKGDLYEFDEDIEKHKTRKKLKRESEEYNKTIQRILKNIMNKNKIEKKENAFCDQKKIKKKKTLNQAPKTSKNKPYLKSSTHNPKVGGIKEIVKTEAHILKNRSENPNLKKKEESQNVLHATVPDNCENLQENYPSDDDCFGFTPSDSAESPKIKIISDIQLQARKELNFSIGSPTLFNNGRPDANSTMLNNRQPNATSTVPNSVLTPWRFNEINVKRNPHFITLKDSSLPCINQEMVLDHTIVDKFEDMSKNVTKKDTTQKKIKKKRLENKENTSSLFDIELSPIKSTNKISFQSSPLKRKILGERNDNVIESEVPSFGFNTSVEEITEENPSTKNKEDRPFRFSMNINDRKYERKKMRKIKEKIEPYIADSEESDSNSESECGDIKLFEDFTSTEDRLELPDSVITKNKKKRKRNGDLQKHKRRKDIRTKEEEEEAEKWAVAFNSMCEEIDKFPLEVE